VSLADQSPIQDKELNRSPHNFKLDLLHDFGGAILFSIPLLMTMEMWWLGFYMDRYRLALFILVTFLMVIGLSHIEGGDETFKLEVLDAFTACAVGYVVATVMLLLFGIIRSGMSPDELIGKIALHAVPCSIGAILARRQLGVEETQKEEERLGPYGGKIFLMSAGAVFLAFQLAPTEEMVKIGYQITGWHAAGLAILSLCIMQSFVYSVEAKENGRSGFSFDFFWGVFLRFTIVGYALALLISLYVLWTFGRLDGEILSEAILSILVLGFPAAVGASAARLIL
jgi:putative integral membrane protein (TIGR02587 family)